MINVFDLRKVTEKRDAQSIINYMTRHIYHKPITIKYPTTTKNGKA